MREQDVLAFEAAFPGSHFAQGARRRLEEEKRRAEDLASEPQALDPEFFALDPAVIDAERAHREWRAKQARLEEQAREWYEENATERDRIKREMRKYLRSPEGRDGATDFDVRAHIDEKHDVDWLGIRLCIESLIRSRAIKVVQERDEDGDLVERKLYDPKEFSRLRPERRFAVKDIGTVPQAVLHQPGLTGARLKIAVSLSGHFYRTRRAWAKTRAIGYRELSKVAGVAENTADDAVSWLIGEGLLEVVRKATGSRGREYRWTVKTKTYKAPRKRSMK